MNSFHEEKRSILIKIEASDKVKSRNDEEITWKETKRRLDYNINKKIYHN